MKILKRISTQIFFLLIGTLLFFSGELNASETLGEWLELETKHTIIRYKSIETLEHYQKSIQYGSGWWSTTASFAQFSTDETRKIASMKTDEIFERVREILGMEKKFNKVRINLYPDTQTLKKIYGELYQQECPFRAWYDYKTNTLSLNVQDLNEGMLAHELAHSIIDHFLLVRPPRNTAEILARYVDMHLK